MVKAEVPDGDAATTYQGMSLLRERSLQHGRSTLIGDEGVWSPASAAEVQTRLTNVEGADLSYDDRLHAALDGAQRQVVLLAADLRYMHLLPMYGMAGDVKERKLDQLLAIVGEGVPPELRPTLEPGVVAWGSGYSRAWDQFRLLVRFAGWISGLGPEARERVLGDPWAFKDGVFALEASGAQMARESLLHIVHPETFDAVFNEHHKNKIQRRWPELVQTPDDRDRALIEIRQALEARHGRRIDWYEPAIKDLWDPSETTPGSEVSAHPGNGHDPVAENELAAAADDVHVPLQWLLQVEGLLRDKGQLVFYGPPGTGKTFIAQRLARALTTDPGHLRLVQFHPSTSYEDFFEGYRPRIDDAGHMVYKLVPGPLARIAEAAASDPDHDYVLIIDEINRANLPRVLGELLYLLEYRDQEITTLYREGEPFSLPKNVLLIGTMNTADRSIALIDAALRRRFHFVPMFPDAPPIGGLLDRWTEAHDGDPRWPRLLHGVNDWLRQDLGGPDLQVGPSHFLTKGLDEEGVRLVWEYSIYPYIEDQLFERPERLTRYRWENIVSQFVSTPTPTSGDELAPVDDEDSNIS